MSMSNDRSIVQFHLTSAHRNRQCFGQTGVITSTDSSETTSLQYRSSPAYRSATTTFDNGVAHNHNHLSCPVAISSIHGPLVHDTLTGAYSGQWTLCRQTVTHLLPKNYPSLGGYYVVVAFGGAYRVPFCLLPTSSTTVFHAVSVSWLSMIEGISDIVRNSADAGLWFPSQPTDDAQTRDIIAAHDGFDAVHPCHVLRAPPAFLLENGSDRVKMEFDPLETTVLHITVKGEQGRCLQNLADLLRKQQPVLLHIGGTTNVLDGAEVCSSNIFGVDEVTGPTFTPGTTSPVFSLYVTARSDDSMGATQPTRDEQNRLSEWGPLVPESGDEAHYDANIGAVIIMGPLIAPTFRGTLIDQLVILRFTLRGWAPGDTLLSYRDGDSGQVVWSLAWDYPADQGGGGVETGLDMWATLRYGGVRRPIELQQNLDVRGFQSIGDSQLLSNAYLENKPCQVTLALFVHSQTGMVEWIWSGRTVDGALYARTNGKVATGTVNGWTAPTTPVVQHGGLHVGKGVDMAYHDIRVYSTSETQSTDMVVEHARVYQDPVYSQDLVITQSTPMAVQAPSPSTGTPTPISHDTDDAWGLALRLGKAPPLSTKASIGTMYIEVWIRVQTPTYGPTYALTRLISSRSSSRSSMQTMTDINVRLMYVTIPALGVMRVSNRPLLHIPSWWVAVRLNESLMQSSSSAVTTITGINNVTSTTAPSWVHSRGTLVFRAHLDKYTAGVSVALQLACITPSAKLRCESTALQQSNIGLPLVCIFAEDGEVLDLVPTIGGVGVPIEAGPLLPDDIAHVGLQLETSVVANVTQRKM